LRSTWVNNKILDINTATQLLGKPLERDYSVADLLKRPELNYAGLMSFQLPNGSLMAGPGQEDPAVAEQVEIQIKYAGYVERQQEEVRRMAQQAEQAIPDDLDYDSLSSLSIEVRQKLKASRPATI